MAKQITSRQKLVVVLALMALLGGGTLAYWLFFSEPAQPWRVRWRIARYLKKQSGKSHFQVNFKFPSKQEMARTSADAGAASDATSVKGGAPKKDFDTLKGEYITIMKEALVLERELAEGQNALEQMQARLAAAAKPAEASSNAPPSDLAVLSNRVATLQQDLSAKQQVLTGKNDALAPIVEGLWAFQRMWAAQRQATDNVDAGELSVARAEWAREIRRKFDEAATYGAMYELIGQQLWVAGRLLKSANVLHRRVALSIVRQAAGDAQRTTEDTWLAARICEGYVWPHLDAADYSGGRTPLSVENILNDCADVFRRADEPPNIIRNYQLLLATTKSPQRMDWARVQLAQAYEQNGDLAQAVRYLKQVKATNDFGWAMRRLPWLEQRLKPQR